MIFKVTTRHAICAALYLARHGKDRTVAAEEIARTRGIPSAYLPRLLGRLVKRGILQSHHGGREKGYRMIRDPARITLFEVLDAFEGWSEKGCLLRPSNDTCLCPAKHHWDEIQRRMFAPLKSYSLADCLASDPNSRSSTVLAPGSETKTCGFPFVPMGPGSKNVME